MKKNKIVIGVVIGVLVIVGILVFGRLGLLNIIQMPPYENQAYISGKTLIIPFEKSFTQSTGDILHFCYISSQTDPCRFPKICVSESDCLSIGATWNNECIITPELLSTANRNVLIESIIPPEYTYYGRSYPVEVEVLFPETCASPSNNWDLDIKTVSALQGGTYSVKGQIIYNFGGTEQKIIIYRLENNECNIYNIYPVERTINDYDNLDDCKSHIGQNLVNVYRGNNCTQISIPITEKQDSDFENQEECELSIKPNNYFMIILVTVIILGVFIGLLFLYLKTRRR